MDKYVVLTEYENGRFGISDKQFSDAKQAERLARLRRRRKGVKRAGVRHITSEDVDIKNLI